MKTLHRIGIASIATRMLYLGAGAWAQSDPSEHASTHTASDGTQVTVVSGQPQPRSYGPKPAFEQLDTNRDGFIDRGEAEAFVPASNDFDHLAFHTTRISRRAYDRWDYR